MSLRDDAVLVDHVCDAPRIFVFRRVTGAVRDADAPIDVAQERERKIEFLREVAILGLRVEADAEDLRVLRLVLGLEVPEPGTFARSTGCVGLWIKPEHDFLAAQAGQRDAIAEVIGGVEVRRVGAGREHLRFSSEQRANDSSYSHRVYCSAVTLGEWNKRYRIREQLNDEPAPLLVQAAETLAPGRALDLACGAGRNAVWLARRGWNVVAIDGSSVAIDIVREHDASIDARVLDLETGAPLPFDDETFDLVAILFYLHRPLFDEAKRVLKRGGTIVCAARTRGRYHALRGELARTFMGYEIVHASDAEVAELIARK
jgi:hypothetical protein